MAPISAIRKTGAALSATIVIGFMLASLGAQPAFAQAGLQLSKTVSATTLAPGQSLTYTLTLTNSGPSAATNVTLTDALPDSTTLVAVITTPSGSCSGTTTVACTLPNLAPGGSDVVTFTLLVASNIAHATTISNQAVAVATIAANVVTVISNIVSTVIIPANQIPLDSVRLRALQLAVTNLEAQSSGAAFSGGVDDAIADGFAEGGGTLISPRSNGMRFNFAADDETATRRNPSVSDQYDPVIANRTFALRDGGLSSMDQKNGLPTSVRAFAPDQSMFSNRLDDPFTALGYASPVVTKAPPPLPPAPKVWQLWADVRGTGWTTDQSVGDIHGGQVNAIAGLTRKLTPDFLIGLLAGYENFSYDSNLLDGRLKGDGWTVGSYLGWRLLPGLRFDASVGHSWINYDGVSGTASGAFLGSRWLATTGLIGTYKTLYGFEIEPSAKVYALWEHENSYTDSLGTSQADRNFSSGRASTGVRVAYPWLWSVGAMATPYLGVYADYYFNRDNGVPPLAPILLPTQFVQGWSARLTSGISVALASGPKLSIGGELGGLGSNSFTVWSVRGRVAVPF